MKNESNNIPNGIPHNNIPTSLSLRGHFLSRCVNDILDLNFNVRVMNMRKKNGDEEGAKRHENKSKDIHEKIANNAAQMSDKEISFVCHFGATILTNEIEWN
jgi:hypothetical protein